jgi:type II secretory ATPase GspE/PulE/Tfp pilus assembly ATPase PilB-like protein
MGVEPFLISSSVIGVLSQRLVRTICKECKGQGCKECIQSGFKGRLGIFELMVPDEEIRKMINAKASADEIRKAAIKTGMQLLREDGQKKVESGITTIQEVMRVTVEA